MPRSYDDALKRIPSQKQKIVQLLQERGEAGATNSELVQICLQYNSRLSELNREGYVIETIHVKEGLYKYVLHKKPGGIIYYADAISDVVNAAYIESNDGWIRIDRFLGIMEEHVCKMVRKPGYYKQHYDAYQDQGQQQLELF